MVIGQIGSTFMSITRFNGVRFASLIIGMSPGGTMHLKGKFGVIFILA